MGKGRETLRVGGAVMYDSAGLFNVQRITYDPPFVNQIDLTASKAGGFSNPWTTGYSYAGGNPFPVTATLFPTAGNWVYLPTTMHSTKMNQWNMTYQRQIGMDWVLSASYIGNRTNHIWGGLEMNAANNSAAVCAQFTTGCTTSNTTQRRRLNLQNAAQGKYYGNAIKANDGANARYNGLLVSVNHRLTKGISVLANYTWSHCISGTGTGYATYTNKLQYLDAASFSANAVGTFGNVGRNALRGPSALNIDLGVTRVCSW